MGRITLLTLILLCGFVSAGTVNNEDWRLEKDRQGIQIYTRAVEGSGFREIRGSVTIDGRLSSVVALLQDMNYWPKLNKLFTSVSLYEQLSETESLVYFQMDMPWPVKDRDILYQRTLQQDVKSKIVTMTEVATSGIFNEQDGYVRVVDSTHHWTLVPRQDGGVDVNWVTYTDPNGPIPASMVNWLSVGPPFDSVSVLRKAIENGEYRDARLPYIQEL